MQINTENNPASFLLHAFNNKKSSSNKISLRGLAKKVEISPSYMSEIMTYKKNLSFDLFIKIYQSLDLPIEDLWKWTVHYFPEISVVLKSYKFTPTVQNNEVEKRHYVAHSQFGCFKDWLHVALLELVQLNNFQPQPDWIANRLGITATQAQEAIDTLLKEGFISCEDGTFKKTQAHLKLHSSDSDRYIRSYHASMIKKAQQELGKTQKKEFQKRLITGATFTCNTQHVESLKKYLSDVLEKVCQESNKGEANEVYQLNLQFFPLTQNAECADRDMT